MLLKHTSGKLSRLAAITPPVTSQLERKAAVSIMPGPHCLSEKVCVMKMFISASMLTG